MSDIILSDVRTEIPKTPILGAVLQSGRIAHAAGANRLIVEFLPRWMTSTHVKSLTNPPTTAGNWQTPHVTVTRNFSFGIGVASKRRYASAVQTVQEQVVVGYAPDEVQHDQSFLPPLTSPEGTDSTIPIAGYLKGFNLGDGSGVVEALRAGDIRCTINVVLATLAQTTGTMTTFNDSFDGEMRWTVWGQP